MEEEFVEEVEIKLERQISQEDHEKLEKDIEQITHKIVEKSEFLLRIAIPDSWIPQVELADATEDDEDSKEWKKKLDKWRDMQQSKGIIKSMDLVGSNKVVDSITGNVMQVLQSAIHMKKLKKQVEQVYVLATQRVAGLKLIANLMSKTLPHSFDLINWFCSALRGNSNHLCHYLDDIRGCGTLLESQARESFFLIVKGLLDKLEKSRDETEIRQIINSIRWEYNTDDHKVLEQLKIFKVLRDGNHSSEKLKNLWGSKFKYEFNFKEAPAQGVVKSKEQDRKDDFALLNKVELSREMIDIFETILVGALGKSFQTLEHSHLTTIKLKD